MKNKQKYDKETLSQLDEIHLAFLSNEEAGKAHKIVLMLFYANLGMALIPGLYMKLLCFVLALGYAIYGAVVYVRLDRSGKELEKKYKERNWQIRNGRVLNNESGLLRVRVDQPACIFFTNKNNAK